MRKHRMICSEKGTQTEQNKQVLKCFESKCLLDDRRRSSSRTRPCKDSTWALCYLKTLSETLAEHHRQQAETTQQVGCVASRDRTENAGIRCAFRRQRLQQPLQPAVTCADTPAELEFLLEFLQQLARALTRLREAHAYVCCDACMRFLWYGGIFALRCLDACAASVHATTLSLDAVHWYTWILAVHLVFIEKRFCSIVEPRDDAALQASDAMGTPRGDTTIHDEAATSRVTAGATGSMAVPWLRQVGVVLASDALAALESGLSNGQNWKLPECFELEMLNATASSLQAGRWVPVVLWALERCEDLPGQGHDENDAPTALRMNHDVDADTDAQLTALGLRIFLATHALAPVSVEEIHTMARDAAVASLYIRFGRWLADTVMSKLTRIYAELQNDAGTSPSSHALVTTRSCFETIRDALLSNLHHWQTLMHDYWNREPALLRAMLWISARLHALRFGERTRTQVRCLGRLVCEIGRSEACDENDRNALFGWFVEQLLPLDGAMLASCVLEDEWMLHWLLEDWANSESANACQQLARRIERDALVQRHDASCEQQQQQHTVLQATEVLHLSELLLRDPATLRGGTIPERQPGDCWRALKPPSTLRVLVRRAHRQPLVQEYLVHVVVQAASQEKITMDPRLAQWCLTQLQQKLRAAVCRLRTNAVEEHAPATHTSTLSSVAESITSTTDQLQQLTQSSMRQAADTCERERLRAWAAAVLHNTAADLYEHIRTVSASATSNADANSQDASVQSAYAAAAHCWQHTLMLSWPRDAPSAGSDSDHHSTLPAQWIRTGLQRLAYALQAWVRAQRPDSARLLWDECSQFLWRLHESNAPPEASLRATAIAQSCTVAPPSPLPSPPPWELCAALFRLVQAGLRGCPKSDAAQPFLDSFSTEALCLLGVAMERVWRRSVRAATTTTTNINTMNSMDARGASSQLDDTYVIYEAVRRTMARRLGATGAGEAAPEPALSASPLPRCTSAAVETLHQQLCVARALLPGAVLRRCVRAPTPATTSPDLSAAAPLETTTPPSSTEEAESYPADTDDAFTRDLAALYDALERMLQHLLRCPGSSDDSSAPADKPTDAIDEHSTQASSAEDESPSHAARHLFHLVQSWRHSWLQVRSPACIAHCWFVWWQRELAWDAFEVAARLFQLADHTLPALYCLDAMHRCARGDRWRQALCAARAMLLAEQLGWTHQVMRQRHRLRQLVESDILEAPAAAHATLSTWGQRMLAYTAAAAAAAAAAPDSVEDADRFEAPVARSTLADANASLADMLALHDSEMRSAKQLASSHLLVEAIEHANRALGCALQAQQLLLPCKSTPSPAIPVLGAGTSVLARSTAAIVGDLVIATQSRPVEAAELRPVDAVVEYPTRALCRSLDLLANLSICLGAWKDALYYHERIQALCAGPPAPVLLDAARSRSLMQLSLLRTRAGQAELAEQCRRQAVALCRAWNGCMNAAYSLWTLPLAVQQIQQQVFRLYWLRRNATSPRDTTFDQRFLAALQQAVERAQQLVAQQLHSRVHSESDQVGALPWDALLQLQQHRALLVSTTGDQHNSTSSAAAMLQEAAQRLRALLAASTAGQCLPAYLEALGLYLGLASSHSRYTMAKRPDARQLHDHVAHCWQLCKAYLLPLQNGMSRSRSGIPAPDLGGSPWLVASAIYAEVAFAMLRVAAIDRNVPASRPLRVCGTATLLRSFAPRWRQRCALLRRRAKAADANAEADAAPAPSVWDTLPPLQYLERLGRLLPLGWMIIALRYDATSGQSARVALWRSGAAPEPPADLVDQLGSISLQQQQQQQQPQDAPHDVADESLSWTPCNEHAECSCTKAARGSVLHLHAQRLVHDDQRPDAQQLARELAQLLQAGTQTHLASESEALSLSAPERRAWWDTRTRLDQQLGRWLDQRLETLLCGLPLAASVSNAASASQLQQFDGAGSVPDATSSDSGVAPVVLLLLDAEHDLLPLESTPTLRHAAAMRFPASAAIEQALERYHHLTRSAVPGWQRGAFLLNPAGDLGRTERFLRPLLEHHPGFRLRYGWTDLAATAAASANADSAAGADDSQRASITQALAAVQPCVLLYCGHGTGEAYLQPRRLVRQTTTLPQAVFLMGCRSGLLEHAEALDAHGAALDWLAAGAHGVVAQLWDVTDGDLDRLTVATWQHLSAATSPQCVGAKSSPVDAMAPRGSDSNAQPPATMPGKPWTCTSSEELCPLEATRSEPHQRSATTQAVLSSSISLHEREQADAQRLGREQPVEYPRRRRHHHQHHQRQEQFYADSDCRCVVEDTRSTAAPLLVASALQAGRAACRLRWVNAAASVVYGAPFR